MSSETENGAVNVAEPAVTVHCTVAPLNPPFSASSTRTIRGAGSGTLMTLAWRSPDFLRSAAAGGTMWTCVESFRCVGVSATTQTLSRSAGLPVNSAV